MIKFRLIEHIPTFVEHDPEDRKVFYAASINEIPWVMEWKQNPEFFRFSIGGRNYDYKKFILMVELKEGKSWYVIGYLDRDIPDLPGWEPKEDE